MIFFSYQCPEKKWEKVLILVKLSQNESQGN